MNDSTASRQKKSLAKIMRQAALALTSRVAVLLLSLLWSIILARVLGPEQRGVYGLLVTIPELLVTIGNLGVVGSVYYYVGKKHYDPRRISGMSIIFTLVQGTILGVIGYCIVRYNWFSKEMTGVAPFALYLALLLPLTLGMRLFRAFLVALARIKSALALTIIETVMPILFFLALWAWGVEPLWAAVIALLLERTATTGIQLLLIARQKAFPPIWDFGVLKNSLGYGMSVFFAGCFEMGLLRLDYLFLTAMVGPKYLGYYAIATRLAEIILILPQSLMIPYIPVILGTDAKDKASVTPVLIKYVLLSMSLIAAVIAVVGMPLMQLMYGPEYAPAYTPLLMLLPGVVAMSLFKLLRFEFSARNKGWLLTWISGIGLALNVGLNFIFIPKWQASGAALTSSISYCVTIGITLVVYARLSEQNVFSLLIPSLQELHALRQAPGRLRNKLSNRSKQEPLPSTEA